MIPRVGVLNHWNPFFKAAQEIQANRGEALRRLSPPTTNRTCTEPSYTRFETIHREGAAMAFYGEDSRGSMPAKPAATGPRNARVLVVDDDPISRRIVSRMVTALGMRADLADGAPVAQALTTRHRYALVLTDLQMPGMNGHTLASWIKNRWKGTLVCVMTSCISEELEIFAGTDAVDRWLYKPFDMVQLGAMLADLDLLCEPEATE